MTYSRSDGTSTPNLAGLVQLASGFRINDGTFVLTRCDLFDSAPVRSGVRSLSSAHGGFTSASYYDFWPFVIEGYLTVPVLADVWAAKDDLKSHFNLDAGLQTLTVNCSGWAATRQISAIVAGPIQFLEPVMLEKNLPDRDFVIPLAAPDPRLYESSPTNTTVTTSTTIPNGGTTATPFVVRFNGPQTNPRIDLDSSSSGAQRIGVTAVIASGHYIEVNTYDSTTGTLTAVDDTGANALAYVSAATAKTVAAGGSAWTRTHDAGSGSTVVTTRGAWA